MASRAQITTIAAPAIAIRLRISRCQARRSRLTNRTEPIVAGAAGRPTLAVAIWLREANLRVEHRVRDVDHKVDDDVDEGDHERHAHDGWKVVGDRRLIRVPPQAGPGED